MRTPDKNLGMIYFENQCDIPEISGFLAKKNYKLLWFNPMSGKWIKENSRVKTTPHGIIKLDVFPDGVKTSNQDWVLKIKIE